MKTKIWSMVLVLLLAVVHLDADAKRMGGGKSMGRQSSNVTQREAAPAQAPGSTAAPAQSAQSRPATPPAQAPAAAPKKPWGAMLGGLAAGLGLAWLANSLGLGAAFGNILLIALLALAAFAIIGMIMRRKAGGAAASQSPFAYQGAGASPSAADSAPQNAPVARQYNPEKIGNDASARPWEQGAAVGTAGGSMIGSGLAGSQNWGVPEGFDTQGFLEAAKRNFITLQAAWDRNDVTTLRSMMTDEMLSEVRSQLDEREQHRGAPQQAGQPNQTDVVMLDAQLLGIEDMGHAYMASVEFSGMIREESHTGPSPFREVWNMTKPKDGTSGWLVAGLQALQ
ncbi:MAG: Tim44 domain-containing protein [Comamonas sp.]